MNVFQDPTKVVPKGDPQVVRVSMQENEVGGRKDHLPPDQRSPDMSIKHVPNGGSAR